MLRVLAFIFLRVVGITIIFALLIVAARLIGNAQPPPAALRALHLTDCQLPCWLGITPGETTFAEAVQRLNVAYPKPIPGIDTLKVSSNLDTDSSGASVIVYADKTQMVSTIDLVTGEDDQIKLGDIAFVLGTPTITCHSTLPILVYAYDGTAVFIFGLGTGGERLQQHLFRIVIDENSTEDCDTLEYVAHEYATQG